MIVAAVAVGVYGGVLVGQAINDPSKMVCSYKVKCSWEYDPYTVFELSEYRQDDTLRQLGLEYRCLRGNSLYCHLERAACWATDVCRHCGRHGTHQLRLQGIFQIFMAYQPCLSNSVFASSS
jgi:hypothetical protein